MRLYIQLDNTGFLRSFATTSLEECVSSAKYALTRDAYVDAESITIYRLDTTTRALVKVRRVHRGDHVIEL